MGEIYEKKLKKSVKKFGYVRKKAYISSVIVIDDWDSALVNT